MVYRKCHHVFEFSQTYDEALFDQLDLVRTLQRELQFPLANFYELYSLADNSKFSSRHLIAECFCPFQYLHAAPFLFSLLLNELFWSFLRRFSSSSTSSYSLLLYLRISSQIIFSCSSIAERATLNTYNDSYSRGSKCRESNVFSCLFISATIFSLNLFMMSSM